MEHIREVSLRCDRWLRRSLSADRARPETAGAACLKQDERGLSTVEYVILLVLIAALCVGTWNLFGTMIKARLLGAGGEIQQQTNVLDGSGTLTGEPSSGDSESGNATPSSGPRTK